MIEVSAIVDPPFSLSVEFETLGWIAGSTVGKYSGELL